VTRIYEFQVGRNNILRLAEENLTVEQVTEIAIDRAKDLGCRGKVKLVSEREEPNTWEVFTEKYRPVPVDATAKDPNYQFDYTDDAQMARIKEADAVGKLWTMVEDDLGELWYVVPGFHYVNRMAYVITEVPVEKDAAASLYM
jgi:hypothetical protein